MIRSEAVALCWDIDDSGTVFGAYEDRAPKGRNRTSSAKAGFVIDGSLNWLELNPLLPVGSSSRGESTVQYAASALNANDAGQLLGGYEVWNSVSGDLWLSDPQDGLFNLNDLVAGDPADTDVFRTADNLRNVEISEVESITGYGVISGNAYGTPYRAFILTPVLVTP